MKPTHLILTRADGARIELTIEEARDLYRQLAALLEGPQMPTPAPTRYPLSPSIPWPQPLPYWVGPNTGDPVPPLWTITCEARQ